MNKQFLTDRLIVRFLNDTDYGVWINGFKSRKPKQNQFDDEIDVSTWDTIFYQNTVNHLNELANRDEAYVFGVFIQSTGEHIGKLEFTVLKRDQFDWCMLGYLIHNQYWNNGYATELLTVIDEIAKYLNLHRIEAHIHPDNNASIKVIQRSGFDFEVLRKSFMYEHEEWCDYMVYTKII